MSFATWLRLDKHTIRSGLYGFSGFLLGALVAAFDNHGTLPAGSS